MRRLIGAGVLMALAFFVSLWLPDPGQSIAPANAGDVAASSRDTVGAGEEKPLELAGDPMGPSPQPQRVTEHKSVRDNEAVSAPSLDSPELYMDENDGDAPPPEMSDSGSTAPEPESASPPPAAAPKPTPIPPPAKASSGSADATAGGKPAASTTAPKALPPPPPATKSSEPTAIAAAPATKPPGKPSSAAVTQSASPAPSTAAAKSAPTASGKWFVQAGSYSDLGNAQSVEQRIKSLGLPVFIGVVESSKGTFYRVRSGPFASREQADSARTKVQGSQIVASVVQDG